MKSLISAGLLGLVILLGIGGCASNPKPPDTALKPKRITEQAKPAMVIVLTTHKTTSSLPEANLNSEKAERDLMSNFEYFLRRMINDSEEYLSYEKRQEMASLAAAAALLKLLDDMTKNLDLYLVPGKRTTSQVEVLSVGTGFFVSDNGYIVTNAHVVSPNESKVKEYVIEQTLKTKIKQMALEFITGVAESFEKLELTLADEKIEKMAVVLTDFYLTHIRVNPVQSSVKVFSGVGVPGTPSTTKSLTAEVVKSGLGEPIPGKDVAILKVSQDNCFTVELGDDKDLGAGDPIFVYGYPANVTFFKEFDPSSVSEPSLTSGVISSRRKMQDGWEALQVDADVQRGTSGGPVFNDKGKVIGIATFSVGSAEESDSSSKSNFIVPATVVKEFLDRVNVDLKPGETSTRTVYFEALDLFEKEHYKSALEKLRQIDSLNPGSPVIQKLKQNAEQNILEGKDRTPHPLLVPIIIVGTLGVFILTAFLMAVGLRKRRLKAQSFSQPSDDTTED